MVRVISLVAAQDFRISTALKTRTKKEGTFTNTISYFLIPQPNSLFVQYSHQTLSVSFQDLVTSLESAWKHATIQEPSSVS